MAPSFRSLTVLAVSLASFAFSRAADDVKSFQLRGTNPDGKGGYEGMVEVRKQGDTADVRWITGKDKQETIGFAIKSENTMGAGYGGQALYSIAIYELQGKKIHATWALTSKPGTVGKYDLKGSSNFEGTYKFTEGVGMVKMTPTKGGSYKMSWDLTTGHYEGIGVRLGNSLVAVAGEPGASLGVAAYRPSGDDIEGVWTTVGLGGVGKEVWSLPAGEATAKTGGSSASKDGQTVTFGGDEYALKTNTSAPGQPTSELREYLRQGEDWNGYGKMVALRLMSRDLKADAATLAKGTLEQTKKSFPEAYIKEILMEPDHAMVFFVIVSGQDAEMNLWDFRRTPNGFPSAQFVLRNKAPYDTKAKFKAEQDKNYDSWLAEIQVLASQADGILTASAKGTASAPPPPVAKSAKEDLPPELVEAIGADLKKCGAIGEKFIGLLKEGDTKSAVTLLSEKAFKKESREEFEAGLSKSAKVFGALQNFSPDKDGTDFGVVDGVMTFTLKGDAQYANGAAKETLRFIRNEKGEVEFVGYGRTAKK